MLCSVNLVTVGLQRTTKGPKAIERLRKKLSEQESLLLLMSPNMAFRVANRNGKVSLEREKFEIKFTEGAKVLVVIAAVLPSAGQHGAIAPLERKKIPN